MRLTTRNTETIYRVAFKAKAGGLVHSAHRNHHDALTSIARRFAGGGYTLATLTKIARPRNGWGSERVLATEAFTPAGSYVSTAA